MVDLEKVSSGRAEAINFEQLDVLLLSLKSYWDYSNQRPFWPKSKASPINANESQKVLAYEI